jgi:hypothetical protein
MGAGARALGAFLKSTSRSIRVRLRFVAVAYVSGRETLSGVLLPVVTTFY